MESSSVAFSLDLTVAPEDSDLLSLALWESGSTGIVDEGRTLRAFFGAEADSRALIEQFARHSPRVTSHADRDWVAESRARWQPLAVGERFYLVPDWMDDPAPEGRVRIPINPGLACGTGAHESTRLSFLAIERYARGGVFADIGCGSGLLSVGALLAGFADRAIGCDLDETAVAIARTNARGLAADFFLGTAAAIRSASIAVANISAPACIRLMPELLRIAPLVIVSGFEEHESEEVAAAGGTLIDTFAENAWRALVISRTE